MTDAINPFLEEDDEDDPEEILLAQNHNLIHSRIEEPIAATWELDQPSPELLEDDEDYGEPHPEVAGEPFEPTGTLLDQAFADIEADIERASGEENDNSPTEIPPPVQEEASLDDMGEEPLNPWAYTDESEENIPPELAWGEPPKEPLAPAQEAVGEESSVKNEEPEGFFNRLKHRVKSEINPEDDSEDDGAPVHPSSLEDKEASENPYKRFSSAIANTLLKIRPLRRIEKLIRLLALAIPIVLLLLLVLVFLSGGKSKAPSHSKSRNPTVGAKNSPIAPGATRGPIPSGGRAFTQSSYDSKTHTISTLVKNTGNVILRLDPIYSIGRNKICSLPEVTILIGQTKTLHLTCDAPNDKIKESFQWLQ